MRRRLHDEEHAGELNIVPYLDIVTNLVMFMLLSMSGLLAFGVVNVSAPKIGGDAAGPGGDQPRLLLTVAISKRGFYVAGAGGVLGGPGDQQNLDQTQAPTVPLQASGRHDYAKLNEVMARIKDKFPNETNLILTADEDIPYDILIQTMDACREQKVQKPDGTTERKPLFFDVSLSLVS